jgi:tetratricopeptide (TPR) repeat protein
VGLPEPSGPGGGLEAAGADSGPPLPGSVLKALAEEMPALPRVLLPEPPADPQTPVNRPASAEVTHEFPARYQVVGEIARGGMGAILKGRDLDLGRDVALKVMLEGHKGKVELLQRFVEEAQVGGQLQHPGIVPVYELGQSRDRRPYFTMKLVKGRTLAQLLKERKGPAEDLPRLLKVFEQVCQTVAYAHARCVIHRDLKPANVMVGNFGEVQVMDWGLAKVLRRGAADERPDPAEVSVIRTVRSGEASRPPAGEPSGSAGSQTEAGSVLGTPAYMAPEQARGEVETLDERCDVFGLGAILCVILTGAPPYEGRDSSRVRARAVEADLAEALGRLERCGADAKLVGLARQCLQPRQEDRPRDAGEVAGAITAYLESVQQRLKQAEVERAAASARAEEEAKRRQVEEGKARVERQRRRLTMALAAALVLLLAGGLWFQSERARRRAEAEQGIRAALEQARKLRGEWQKKLAEPGGVFALLNRPREWRARLDSACEAVGRAGQLVRDAGGGVSEDLKKDTEELAAQLSRDTADHELAVGLEEARLSKMAWAPGQGGYNLAGAAARYEKLFAGAGLAVLTADLGEVAARLRASPIREQLVAALDDWTYCALHRGRRKAGLRLLAVARRADPGDDPWRQQIRTPGVLKDVQAVLRLTREAPQEGLSPHLLYVVSTLLPRGGEAKIQWLRQAQRRFPEDFWLNVSLGQVLSDLDSAARRVGPTRDGYSFRKKTYHQAEGAGFLRIAVTVRPDSATAWNNLCAALCYAGDGEGALDACRRSLALDQSFTAGWVNLGGLLCNQGKTAEGLAILKKAVAVDPNDPRAWYGLANAYLLRKDPKKAAELYRKVLDMAPDYIAWTNLAVALRQLNDLPGAVKAGWKAIALEPENPVAWSNLADPFEKQGDRKGALAAVRKALTIDPDQEAAWARLGRLLYQEAQYQEAADAFRKAIQLGGKNTASCWTNLGLTLEKLKQPGPALDAFKKAVEVDPKNAAAWINLGNTLLMGDDFASGLEALEKAIILDSGSPKAWLSLGLARMQQKDWGRAVEAFRKATEIDSRYAAAWEWLGRARYEQRDSPRAREALQKAVELGAHNAGVWARLGDVRQKLGDTPGAISAFRKALHLAPDRANTWCSLGAALRTQADFPGALKAFQEAVRLAPEDGGYWNNLGAVLHGLKRMKEAIAAQRKAVFLRPDDPVVLYNLGDTLLVAGEPTEALRLFRKSISLDPKFADGHRGLALALLETGEFEAAAAANRQALTVLPAGDRRVSETMRQLRRCEQLLAQQRRLPAVLKGEPASAEELVALAELCRFTKRYRDAVKLYAGALAADPGLPLVSRLQHRYHAACAALRASRGEGMPAAAPGEEERAKLRRQAYDWLRANLERWQKLHDDGSLDAILEIPRILEPWRTAPDLAGVREPDELAKLPQAERPGWEKLWAGAEQLGKQARAAFRETRLAGVLTAQQPEKAHAVELQAGKLYCFDMEDCPFSPGLRLEDAAGKRLAQNDSFSSPSPTARILFRAWRDGAYRVVATSPQQRGRGRYTVVVREFVGKAK